MNDFYHQELALGRWRGFSLLEQMANIGSEVERALNRRREGNKKSAELAFFRSLELWDLTLADLKNRNRLKELTRGREIWADYFFFGNEYRSTAKIWRKYFLAFAIAARNGK